MTYLPRLSAAGFVLAAVFLPFAACSSEVITSTGGSGPGGSTGGPTANGGAGGAVGTAGAGGLAGTGGAGGAPACPAMQPNTGDPCPVPGQSCTFGPGCCPPLFVCEDGGWVEIPVDCPAPVWCPASPPFLGDACNLCETAVPCPYTCPGSTAQITASCGPDGKWTYMGDCPVPPPTTCQGVPCAPGEICVHATPIAQGPPAESKCMPDPCKPGPLGCSCAGDLCPSGYPCVGATEQTVECACTNCD